MGCVSSAFLEEGADDDGRRRIISHHHIVSLTSSTYGILNYPSASSASPPIGPPPTAASLPPPPPPPPTNLIRSGPQKEQEPEAEPEEVINSWELMAGLLDPSTPARPPLPPTPSCSSRRRRIRFPLRPIDGNAWPSPPPPPSAAAALVLYTTSLRGVRSTFEACNAVRAALQAHGVAFRERDVSMDRGFREELRDLLLSPGPSYCGSGSGTTTATTKRKVPSLPRLFVRGRHVGGAEEVLRLDEQGLLAPLLEGLPRARGGTYCCDGCGGMRFLPCFDCSGSRKVLLSCIPNADTTATPTPTPTKQQQQQQGNCRRRTVVVRCGECNENGLVLCPICS